MTFTRIFIYRIGEGKIVEGWENDAFLFSAFKYEEASILSAIFPLNSVFTFVVSVVFFKAGIKPMIVVGFLIIMAASLLVGVYHTRLQPSKGIVFALLYSFFLGGWHWA